MSKFRARSYLTLRLAFASFAFFPLFLPRGLRLRCCTLPLPRPGCSPVSLLPLCTFVFFSGILVWAVVGSIATGWSSRWLHWDVSTEVAPAVPLHPGVRDPRNRGRPLAILLPTNHCPFCVQTSYTGILFIGRTLFPLVREFFRNSPVAPLRNWTTVFVRLTYCPGTLHGALASWRNV